MSDKAKLKDDNAYDTDGDEEEEEDVLETQPSMNSQPSSAASGQASPVEFKLEIETSSDSDASSDDSDDTFLEKLKTVKPKDSKRRRSDAHGKSHDLERKARGSKCMDGSPPRKKRMTKLNVDTKLYQGQRELNRKQKEKENEKKEKKLEKEQRKLEKERKKLEALKKQTAKEAATEAKKHWALTAAKNKVPSKIKSEPKLLDSDSDSSVEIVGSTPVASKSASRIISAKAGTLKTDAKYPESKKGKVVTVSGSKWLDEVKKDTLNQARAVKRHQTKNTKEVIQRLDNQDIILRDILMSRAADNNVDGANVGGGASDASQLMSRFTAQDGVINETNQTSNKTYNRTKKTHEDIAGIKKTVDEILDIVKNKCPHTKADCGSPPSIGSVGSSGSAPPVATAPTPNNRSAGVNPSITVNHRHQYFQHSHMGPAPDGSGTQIHHSVGVNHMSTTPRVTNPYQKQQGNPHQKPTHYLKLTDKGQKRLNPTYIGPLNGGGCNPNNNNNNNGQNGGNNGGNNGGGGYSGPNGPQYYAQV